MVEQRREHETMRLIRRVSVGTESWMIDLNMYIASSYGD